MTIPKRNLGESEQWGRATEKEIEDLKSRIRSLEGGRKITAKAQSILADLVSRGEVKDQILQDQIDFQGTTTYANTPPTENIPDPGDPDAGGEVFPPPDPSEGENPSGDEGDTDPFPPFVPDETIPEPDQQWVYVDPDTGRVEGEWHLIDEIWEPRQIGSGTIASEAVIREKISQDILDELDQASQDANQAIIAANGKNTIYRGPNEPTPPQGGFVAGDTWFDTSSGDTTIKTWDEDEWVVEEVGTESLAVGAITAGSGVIASLDAGVISTGTLNADRLAANSITGEKLIIASVDGDRLKDDTIPGTVIKDGAITTGKIAAGAIETDNLAANAVTADIIAANAVGADKLAANSVTADKLAANAVTADKIAANAIDGKIITGALIRTAASGERVEITSSTGLRYTNPGIGCMDLGVIGDPEPLARDFAGVRFSDPDEDPTVNSPGLVGASDLIKLMGPGSSVELYDGRIHLSSYLDDPGFQHLQNGVTIGSVNTFMYAIDLENDENSAHILVNALNGTIELGGSTHTEYGINVFSTPNERDSSLSEPRQGTEAYTGTGNNLTKWVRRNNTWWHYNAATELTTQNLNNLIQAGQYIQRVNANASTARNYPEARAGMLEVMDGDTAGSRYMTYQRYTEYSTGRTWIRTYYRSWNAWTLIGGGTGAIWESLTSYYASGFSGSWFEGSIIGPEVEISLGVDGNMPVGSTTVTRALPVKWRPPLNKQSACWLSGNNEGMAFIRPNGTIAVINRSPGTRVSAQITLKYRT